MSNSRTVSQFLQTKDVDQLFGNIKKICESIGRTAALIEDTNVRKRLVPVLETLSDVDKNFAADVKAIEELQAMELDEDVALYAKFREIRDNTNVEDLGRCHGKIDDVRERITATQESEGPDMEVLAVTYSEKDPISKENIKDPVKNTICGHVYDRDSVSSFIAQCKNLRQLCQCPVRSCPNKQQLQMARMIPFPEFFNHIQKQ